MSRKCVLIGGSIEFVGKQPQMHGSRAELQNWFGVDALLQLARRVGRTGSPAA